MLIIVHYGDIQRSLKSSFDVETARSADVFQIDGAESRRDVLYGSDNFIGVLAVEADGPGIDPCQLLKEHGLSFHDGKGGFRTEVAESQHGRSVRDDGEAVALGGEGIGFGLVLRDGLRYPSDAGGVDHRQHIARGDRKFTLHLDLATEVQEEDAVRG